LRAARIDEVARSETDSDPPQTSRRSSVNDRKNCRLAIVRKSLPHNDLRNILQSAGFGIDLAPFARLMCRWLVFQPRNPGLMAVAHRRPEVSEHPDGGFYFASHGNEPTGRTARPTCLNDWILFGYASSHPSALSVHHPPATRFGGNSWSG
jgi:hypothetical protein